MVYRAGVISIVGEMWSSIGYDDGDRIVDCTDHCYPRTMTEDESVEGPWYKE